MDKDRQPAGVITVFLSLLLPLFLMLISTCLESARAEALRLRGQIAADAAARSVFAQYDRALFERYGLLFVSSAIDLKTDMEAMAQEYAILNTKKGRGGGMLFGMKLISVEAENIKPADQNDGEGFLEEVSARVRDTGRWQSAQQAAKEAGFENTDTLQAAAVEFIIETFKAFSDEEGSGFQMEYCITGNNTEEGCRTEMERLLYEERMKIWLPYYEDAEGQNKPEGDGMTDGGDGENITSKNAPPNGGATEPSFEERARTAAGNDANALLNGGAVCEFADGSGRELTYLSYVRRFLYQMDAQTLYDRAMTAIELDLQDVEPGFSFSQCTGSAGLRFVFTSEPVMPFSVFPSGYEFNFFAEYSYIS